MLSHSYKMLTGEERFAIFTVGVFDLIAKDLPLLSLLCGIATDSQRHLPPGFFSRELTSAARTDKRLFPHIEFHQMRNRKNFLQ